MQINRMTHNWLLLVRYNYSVTAHDKLSAFFDQALGAGIPQSSLVGMLTAQGWPEQEVYRALGEYYRRSIGLDIPSRPESGTSAKDAFFYLLIFTTLATWTFGFGSLAFDLIDRWIADPLFQQRAVYETESITYALAALIIAFPLFLLLSRSVVRESAAHPEKLESPVRKWLTYMALVVAAGIFMGDLITALAFFLRGEFTSRFLAKSCVVLLLSGGVCSYYFGGLRKTKDDVVRTPPRVNRDRLMLVFSAAFVVLIVALGLLNLGAPRIQRDLRADSQRIMQLYQLHNQVTNYWGAHASTLPASLDGLPFSAYADPVTRLPYDYHALSNGHYELCATFARASDQQAATFNVDQQAWAHAAGHHCFEFVESTVVPFPMQYSGN